MERYRSRPIRNTHILSGCFLALFAAAALGGLAGHAVGVSAVKASALRQQTLQGEEVKHLRKEIERLEGQLRELQKPPA